MGYQPKEIKYKIEKENGLYFIYEYNFDYDYWNVLDGAFTFLGAKYILNKIIKFNKSKNMTFYYTSDGELIERLI